MATPGGRGMPSRTISSRATTSAWTSMGSNSTPQDDKSSFVLAQDDQPGRVYRRAFIACHYTRHAMTTQRPLYHRFAWAFDLVVPDASAGRVRKLASLLRRHGVRPPARVLDAGCSTGNHAAPSRAAAIASWAWTVQRRCSPRPAPGARATARPTFRHADLTTYRPITLAAGLCRGVLH